MTKGQAAIIFGKLMKFDTVSNSCTSGCSIELCLLSLPHKEPDPRSGRVYRSPQAVSAPGQRQGCSSPAYRFPSGRSAAALPGLPGIFFSIRTGEAVPLTRIKNSSPPNLPTISVWRKRFRSIFPHIPESGLRQYVLSCHLLF